MLDLTKRIAARIARVRLPTLRTPAAFARLRDVFAPHFRRAIDVADPAWTQGSAWFARREPREKLLLRVLGIIFAGLFLYELIYAPIVSLRGDLAERVSTRQQDLVGIRAMMRTYQRLQAELATTQKRMIAGDRDFSLFSVVQKTLSKSVGREKITSITPGDRVVTGGFKQYTVDVKLSGISLVQVVDTLYGVQTLTVPVTVSNFQLHEHGQDTHSFDVDLTCSALGKNG